MKKCSCCQKEKPTSEFQKHKSKKDGLRCWCKSCCSEKRKNSPNTKHAYSKPCGKCERIVESIPDSDEAENAALKEQVEILIEFIPKDFMMPLDWQSVVDKARKILDGGKDEAI